jgi:hypothetical protein
MGKMKKFCERSAAANGYCLTYPHPLIEGAARRPRYVQKERLDFLPLPPSWLAAVLVALGFKFQYSLVRVCAQGEDSGEMCEGPCLLVFFFVMLFGAL